MTDDASASAAAWERLSTLFESAMALSPDKRQTFLDSVSEEDAPLRTELAALLAAADDAPVFLRALASDVIAPTFDVAAATPDDRPFTEISLASPRLLTGSRIRHYDVLTPVGAGGMGVVHRGRDTRLGRDVALKFLSPDNFSDPSARHRLVREAQAASALDHPNVCAMHAIEETDDGGLCLVMSYCAGGTLRDRLRAGPMTVLEAVKIATQLASGLASAHQRHIVHRDLKPANVGFADGDVAKILDFGVSVRIGVDDTVSAHGTSTFAGTLSYAAPELLRGGAPDVRTDLWALGVVLYEMLAGQRPFAGATEASLLYAILDHEPAPIVRSDGESIPDALSALVNELLSKAPTRRPESADVVLLRLRSLDTAYATVPAPRSTSLTLTWRRHRTRWAVGGGVIVIAALAVFVLRRSPTAEPIASVTRAVQPLPTLAVLPFSVRGGADAEYLRDGMVDLLTPAFDATGLVRGIDPNAVLGAARQLVTTILDSASARAVAERVDADRYVVGSVVRTGSTLTVRATLYRAGGDEAARAQVVVPNADGLSMGVESLVRQLATAELRAPGDTVSALAASTTTSTRALRAYLDGERELRDARPAAAVVHFAEAVKADSQFALAWYRLARAARWSDVDSLNAIATRRAFALVSSLPLRLQQVVRGYNALRFGSPIDAERQFRAIVSDYPTDVDAWMLLGETLFDNNQYAGRLTSEATPAFERVMQLDPRNREVTVYLMELASRADQRGLLDTLFMMYFSPNSAGEQPGIRDTYLALHARRVRGAERNIDDPASAQLALRRAGSDARDLRAARRFATVLVAPANSVAMRVDGQLALASLDVAAAQIASAERHWRAAAALDANATLLHRAMTLTAPMVSVAPDTLRALRQALSVAPTVAVDGLSRDEQVALRAYLGGLLSLRLDDTASLARAEQQIARTGTGNRVSPPLGEALRGHLARARGDLAAAALAFENSVLALPAPVRARVPALQQYADRFAHAEALRALGRNDEANRWYASLRDGPSLWGAPYLQVALERANQR